jgi:hypothetical protein
LDLGQGEPCVPTRKCRIAGDSLLKEIFCESAVVPTELVQMPQATLISGPGVEAPRRLSHGPLPLGVSNGRSDSDRHCLGNLILDCENVSEIAVVTLGPHVVAGRCFHELRGNAKSIAGEPSLAPRLVPLPVRMPLPPAEHQGSIYENQRASGRRHFTTPDEAPRIAAE